MREIPSGLGGAAGVTSERRIRGGVRGPGRTDRGPWAAVDGARYVSGRARAAGRGKVNAQKKPRGGTPGRRVRIGSDQLCVYPSDSIPSHIPHH